MISQWGKRSGEHRTRQVGDRETIPKSLQRTTDCVISGISGDDTAKLVYPLRGEEYTKDFPHPKVLEYTYKSTLV